MNINNTDITYPNDSTDTMSTSIPQNGYLPFVSSLTQSVNNLTSNQVIGIMSDWIVELEKKTADEHLEILTRWFFGDL